MEHETSSCPGTETEGQEATTLLNGQVIQLVKLADERRWRKGIFLALKIMRK